MVAEAYEMRDTRLENSNGMKKQADKERVRERDQRRVWTSQSKKNKEQKGASHCGDPLPTFPPVYSQVTQCEMENRATDTVVYSVVNNHHVRNSEGALTLRLSMQGSTLGIVI